VPEGVIGALRTAFSTAAPRMLLAALAFSGAATGARAESLPLWEAGVGVSVIDFPEYRGSAERRTWVLPFPYIVYRGDYLKADERRGVRGLFFKTESVELDVSFNGTVPVKSSENAARQGMPDLDGTLEIGPSLNFSLLKSADRKTSLELRLPVRGVLASDFSYVDFVGWVFQPTLNVDTRDAFGYTGWKLGFLGGPVYSDGRYNRYFYAVDPAFATATRPAYSPGGGYGGAQFIAALSKRYRDFWIGGFAKWDTLNGAVFADSPLVTARQSWSGGIAIAWMVDESKARVETKNGQ
jgi:outer membrane scaffolding protein for murein synthesis (MipA/OmpV family)